MEVELIDEEVEPAFKPITLKITIANEKQAFALLKALEGQEPTCRPSEYEDAITFALESV